MVCYHGLRYTLACAVRYELEGLVFSIRRLFANPSRAGTPMKRIPPKLFDPNKPPGGLLPEQEPSNADVRRIKEDETPYDSRSD